MKTCNKCKKTKSFDLFSKNKSSKDGFHSNCKKCCMVRITAYQEANKEKLSKQMSNYYQNNKQNILASNADYRKTESGKASIAKAIKKYGFQFPERVKVKQKLKNFKKKHGIRTPEGCQFHHWSYNIKHFRDVIQIPRLMHRKLHKKLIYDPEAFYFKTLEGALLDTKDKHMQYILEG